VNIDKFSIAASQQVQLNTFRSGEHRDTTEHRNVFQPAARSP
jgi:hypothetical protein